MLSEQNYYLIPLNGGAESLYLNGAKKENIAKWRVMKNEGVREKQHA